MFFAATSSATNVGADKDSDKRQREAIASFARRAGYKLVVLVNTYLVVWHLWMRLSPFIWSSAILCSLG